MDKFEKYDSAVFNEIVERPVDLFYSDKTCIITMSFDNLPETNSVDTETWNKFLADSWNQYFAQLDNIFDLLKHCVYHTCLAGRFYKTNSFLSLDDAVYLIKDRFHSADTLFKTWHQLHKLARLILIEKCKESSTGASLVLDLHTRTDGVCVDSQDNENILHLMYLPNEEERVLVFHITVRYNIYEEKSSLISSRNASDLSSDFSHNNILDKPEVLKESESATSPKQSDSFSKSFNDLYETGDWEKYGARPKSKRYFQKNTSDTTANLKEYGTMDYAEKLDARLKDCVKRKIRRFHDRNDRTRSTLYKKPEDDHMNEACSKYQDVSISEMSCLKKCTAEGSPLQGSDSITGTENEQRFAKYQDSSSPLCAGMTSQTDSKFNDKEYLRSLTDTTSDYELSPTKSDSFGPAPFIPLTSEDNSYYEKYGARCKDCSQKHGCKVLENKKECKPPDYFEEGAGATESGGHDLISPQYFENVKGLERLPAIKTEIEEMPIEFHKKYQKIAPSFFKSGGIRESPIYDTNGNEILARSPRQEYTSVAQGHTTLEMPIIRFTQNTAGDDKNVKEVLEPEARANVLRLILKTFFENYKFLDASLQDNQSSGWTMTTNSCRDYCSTFSAAGSELDRIPFADTDNSEEVSISEGSNRIKALSFDDRNSGRFAIKTFDDKISFDWENASNEKSLNMENQSFTFSQEISSENHSEDNKVLTVDGKLLEDTDETHDSFFETFVQNLTKSPTKSPQHSGSLQTSTHEKQISTPEKNSNYSHVLKLIHLKKPDDEIRSQNSPEEELLFDLCDESLELSDYSPESDSVEIEDNDGSES